MKAKSLHHLFFLAASGLSAGSALHAEELPAESLHTEPAAVHADFTVMKNMAMADFEAAAGRNVGFLRYKGNGARFFEAFAGYERRIDAQSGFFAGVFFDHKEEQPRDVGVFGYERELPFGLELMAWIDTRGRPRVELGGEQELLPALSLRWSVNTDKEYSALLEYKLKEGVYVTGGRDSRFGDGVGFRLEF